LTFCTEEKLPCPVDDNSEDETLQRLFSHRGSVKEMKALLLRNNDGSPANMRRLDYLFILIICLVTTSLLLVFAHSNSLTSGDECRYLLLGKQIVEGEVYGHSFPDGRPFLPSVIALFYHLGFDIITVRLIIPIIFMNSALIATFALGKTLFGRKEAYIATLFLFTFPFFWDIGNTVMVDIPLTVFTTLFLLFFYLGVEKEAKYLYISAIFISVALLTKLTIILFVFPAFIYLVVRRKLNICLKKEFIISAALIPLVFAGVYTVFHLFMSAKIDFSYMAGAATVPFRLFDILRLGLAPILVLTIFGISREKRNIYLWLPILTFFLFWAIQGRFFDLRQFISLSPLVGILIGLGFFSLLGKYNKKLISVLFGLLLAISFVHALYLNDYHQETSWGITALSESVNKLEGNGKIAADFSTMATYLQASTDKDIISAFRYSGKYPHTIPTYEIITEEWLQENDVTYLILSIYGEQHRTEFEDSIHPKFLMVLEIPFIEVGQYGQLPQSICQFDSGLYNRCEKNYAKAGTIHKGEQMVFIIYKVK
jgi:hypothetical protein